MIHLNSIIIEGIVAEGSVFDEGKVRYDFPLTVHNLTSDGTEEKEINHFTVRTYGKLAEAGRDYATVNRGVRVTGRLKEEDSKVVIMAEHIEFKPIKA